MTTLNPSRDLDLKGVETDMACLCSPVQKAFDVILYNNRGSAVVRERSGIWVIPQCLVWPAVVHFSSFTG